ncbi:MAG: SDR family oxidoreductase, partial [Ilumatobacter sp.]
MIHSAATVSFDSPLDQAVEINLLGPTRIAALCADLDITPHLVAVSTCYVAGNRRGTAPEQLVSEGPFD